MDERATDKAEAWQKNCMAILGNGEIAVCIKPGPWHGWLFKKHPDGQWVSVEKLPAGPMLPDGHPLGALSANTSAASDHLRRSAPPAEGLAAEFERLAEKATQGEWFEFDSIENQGAYGSGDDCHHGFKSHAVFDAKGKTIVDTLNSDIAEVHVEYDEDGASAWDEVGRNNAAFIAWVYNHRTDILRALKGDPK